MEHVKLEWCTCGGAGRCNGCNLFMCKVCTGAECDLPKDCPGRPLTIEERDGISDGSLNYIDGKWIKYLDHKLEGCCDDCTNGVDHQKGQACQFTRCSVCGVDDSTKAGEYRLKGKCK